MRTASALSIVLLLAASLPLPALAQITIATPAVTDWYYSYVNTGFGSGMAWGQTFIAPDATHTQLDRFELRAASLSYSTPADFTTYIARWDATTQRAVGAPLWTSSLQNATGLASPALGGNTILFETGGVSLTASQTYVLMALPNLSLFGPALGGTSQGTYGGGDMVVFHPAGVTGTAPSYANLSTAWTSVNTTSDLAFGATFSEPGATVVPEPTAPAAALSLTLIAALIIVRRRQQCAFALPP